MLEALIKNVLQCDDDLVHEVAMCRGQRSKLPWPETSDLLYTRTAANKKNNMEYAGFAGLPFFYNNPSNISQYPLLSSGDLDFRHQVIFAFKLPRSGRPNARELPVDDPRIASLCTNCPARHGRRAVAPPRGAGTRLFRKREADELMDETQADYRDIEGSFRG